MKINFKKGFYRLAIIIYSFWIVLWAMICFSGINMDIVQILSALSNYIWGILLGYFIIFGIYLLLRWLTVGFFLVEPIKQESLFKRIQDIIKNLICFKTTKFILMLLILSICLKCINHYFIKKAETRNTKRIAELARYEKQYLNNIKIIDKCIKIYGDKTFLSFNIKNEGDLYLGTLTLEIKYYDTNKKDILLENTFTKNDLFILPKTQENYVIFLDLEHYPYWLKDKVDFELVPIRVEQATVNGTKLYQKSLEDNSQLRSWNKETANKLDWWNGGIMKVNDNIEFSPVSNQVQIRDASFELKDGNIIMTIDIINNDIRTLSLLTVRNRYYIDNNIMIMDTTINIPDVNIRPGETKTYKVVLKRYQYPYYPNFKKIPRYIITPYKFKYK